MTITDGLRMTRLWATSHLKMIKILREAVDFLIKQKLIVNKNTPTTQAIDREIELKEQERKERIAEYRRQKWIEQQNKLRAQRYYEKHKEEIVRQKIIKREKEIRKKRLQNAANNNVNAQNKNNESQSNADKKQNTTTDKKEN